MKFISSFCKIILFYFLFVFHLKDKHGYLGTEIKEKHATIERPVLQISEDMLISTSGQGIGID